MFYSFFLDETRTLLNHVHNELILSPGLTKVFPANAVLLICVYVNIFLPSTLQLTKVNSSHKNKDKGVNFSR